MTKERGSGIKWREGGDGGGWFGGDGGVYSSGRPVCRNVCLSSRTVSVSIRNRYPPTGLNNDARWRHMSNIESNEDILVLVFRLLWLHAECPLLPPTPPSPLLSGNHWLTNAVRSCATVDRCLPSSTSACWNSTAARHPRYVRDTV